METRNIMIVGVGGQGSLLASKLLGRLLLGRGYDIKVSEVHGMSQRGGSVVTYVRYGEKVYSPIIDKGEADYILSFELLEAARWTEYLKPGGKIIILDLNKHPYEIARERYHDTWLGFSRNEIEGWLAAAGFAKISSLVFPADDGKMKFETLFARGDKPEK